MKLLKDQRGDMKQAVIGVIALILLLCLVPVVVDQVQGVDTTGWNFTGSEGAETLLLLIPFVFIAGVIIKVIVDSLKAD